MALGTPRLEPPLVAKVLDERTGVPTGAWLDYFQQIVDQLSSLRASQGRGVTDGSEAEAGNIGEYLTASGSVGLSTGATQGVVTLNLTAGDWDVSGSAQFVAGAGTHSLFAAGIGGLDTVYQATFPGTAIGPAISTATRRYNLTATTAVQLQAQAVFTGTVTCQGTIRARRVR